MSGYTSRVSPPPHASDPSLLQQSSTDAAGAKGYSTQDSQDSLGDNSKDKSSSSCFSCIWIAIRTFFAFIFPCLFGEKSSEDSLFIEKHKENLYKNYKVVIEDFKKYTREVQIAILVRFINIDKMPMQHIIPYILASKAREDIETALQKSTFCQVVNGLQDIHRTQLRDEILMPMKQNAQQPSNNRGSVPSSSSSSSSSAKPAASTSSYEGESPSLTHRATDGDAIFNKDHLAIAQKFIDDYTKNDAIFQHYPMNQNPIIEMFKAYQEEEIQIAILHKLTQIDKLKIKYLCSFILVSKLYESEIKPVLKTTFGYNSAKELKDGDRLKLRTEVLKNIMSARMAKRTKPVSHEVGPSTTSLHKPEIPYAGTGEPSTSSSGSSSSVASSSSVVSSSQPAIDPKLLARYPSLREFPFVVFVTCYSELDFFDLSVIFNLCKDHEKTILLTRELAIAKGAPMAIIMYYVERDQDFFEKVKQKLGKEKSFKTALREALEKNPSKLPDFLNFCKG